MLVKKLMIALAFFVLVQSAAAASFTATVSPTLINSSTSTQMQLTVTNLDSTYNITQVNLTLPVNFTYVAGSCSPSCSGPIDSVIYWVTNIQTNGSFNFSIIADVNGTYNFSISVLDTSNISTQNYTNKFEVNDTTPPKWSNLVPAGTANATYSPGAIYQFNISWTDNIGISRVIFFWQNNPITPNVTGNTYSITLLDLPVGSYNYYWYANDTNKNSNQTPTFTFNVTKAPNPLNLYFNSTINQNISIINNTLLTINLTGIGTLTLYQRGPEDRDYASFPQSFTPTKVGNYNFTATATGNENYTTNSSTYFVLVVPSYQLSTSIQSTYSSLPSTFTVMFSSPPSLEALTIEGDWSGIVARYTMTNSSLTTYSYSIVLPAGSFYWQVYAKSSGYLFPLTGKNSFTVAKATPSIYISASPSWTVQSGTKTTVTCTAVVPVKLYRNATQVSNPDVQTLPIGSYIYSCQSEETQNYTSSSEYAVLTVTQQPFADLAFVQVPSLVFVEQNSSNSTQVVVKNTGNIKQTVNFTIENISVDWTVSPASIDLPAGSNGTFYINFTTTNQNIGDYRGSFKAYSANKTILSNFTLRITLGKEAKENVNKTIEGYRLELLTLEIELNNTKSMGYNVSSIEEALKVAKQLLNQAEDYVAKGDYENAVRALNSIGNLPSNIRKSLEKLKEAKGLPNFTLYIIVGIAVGIGCLLAYLLWPTEIVSQAAPEAKKKSFLERLKSIFVRKKKYEYKGK